MIKLDKTIKYLILTLMILMPILDTTFFFSRITTLAIVLTIFFILLLTLINNKKSRKNFKYLIVYYIFCIIYLIINYVHSKGFTSFFPDNFNYNFYLEFTTILKLMMPLTLLFILRHNTISKKEYFLIIKYWIVMIGGSIIVTNIFKLSLSSYSNEPITYNIFEWGKNIYYSLTASKGFFNYANQEACIMIMLLVMSTYLFFKEGLKNLIYILILTISMIMLGTRISTLGGLLVLVTISIVIVIYNLINRKKLDIKYMYILIPITIWLILIPVSPYSNRNIELIKDFNQTKLENIVTNVDEHDNVQELTQEDNMKKYIEDNYNREILPRRFFVDIYSYNYDPYFWYDFLKNNNPNDINYRMIEINIIKRVKDIDNRDSNILFGISNSRIQNIVNIERDFVLHYYAYGIIGMIILLIIYPFLMMFLSKKIVTCFHIDFIITLCIVCLFILISYMSGNIINFTTPTIPLIFIINYAFMNKNPKKN